MKIMHRQHSPRAGTCKLNKEVRRWLCKVPPVHNQPRLCSSRHLRGNSFPWFFAVIAPHLYSAWVKVMALLTDSNYRCVVTASCTHFLLKVLQKLWWSMELQLVAHTVIPHLNPRAFPARLPVVDMRVDGTGDADHDCFATGYWGKVALADLPGSLSCHNDKKWKGEVFHGNWALLNEKNYANILFCTIRVNQK